MSNVPWKELSETAFGRTPDERERLRSLLNGRDRANTAGDPLLGLMADEAPLLDQVVSQAMASRTSH